jgi:hypothetical protein
MCILQQVICIYVICGYCIVMVVIIIYIGDGGVYGCVVGVCMVMCIYKCGVGVY